MRPCHSWADPRNLMEDPADDRPEPGAQSEQEPVDSCRIVRRTEITVQREITTVIVRRRNPAGKDPEGNR